MFIFFSNDKVVISYTVHKKKTVIGH
jgi:hypothetical protein